MAKLNTLGPVRVEHRSQVTQRVRRVPCSFGYPGPNVLLPGKSLSSRAPLPDPTRSGDYECAGDAQPSAGHRHERFSRRPEVFNHQD